MIEQIRTFLANNPIENIETFFDNENIFWVDWREYDEDIVSYVNDELNEADKIEWKTIPSEKEGALDIVTYRSEVDEIEIKHTAFNRNGFALGAIIASEWIIGRKGNFTVKEVLGL